MATSSATNPDTLVTLKINVDGINKRFKLPLRDLGASTLPDKLRFLLTIPPTSEAIFERFSDSAASFVVLDPNNTSVYKQLYRAAKAKLKLRLKVTIIDKEPMAPKPATVEDEEPTPVAALDQPATPGLPEPLLVPATQARPEYVTFPNESQSVMAALDRDFNDLGLGSRSDRTSPTASSRIKQEKPASPTSYVRTEVPVTYGSAARDKWFAELASVSQGPQRPTPTVQALATTGIFTVYCNNCSDPIPNEHWHCSTCDDGDYDLCQRCVSDGVVCEGRGHWLIKRFVSNGAVINSTTETMAPRPKSSSASASKTTLVEPEESKVVLTRTCNCCVKEMTEDKFVTCCDCEDYDLCFTCHLQNAHGHHPKHRFSPVDEKKPVSIHAKALLAPGRNVGHNAICDGCDKYIYGVRHKCLDCPDWDFCGNCMPNAYLIHPRHRFVPIYEPLNDAATLSQAYAAKARHYGIFCDGPLCNNGCGIQTYIKGDRFKCAVCHDTDFCASCEASPSNDHNRTHPLIKFKTPVRNVSVTTIGDHVNGSQMAVMGDRQPYAASKATETTPTESTNAATQVQTVADLKPMEVKAEIPVEKVDVPETKVVTEAKELPAAAVKEELVAHFVRDTVADATELPPNHVFEQTWYLRNAGKTSWPAGCSVKFVGGDNMFAIDPYRPTSIHELVAAAESTTCYTEVAPGQEADFTVLMRTPSKPGNCISYWRLTGPDGIKFGHRLWCDVVVVGEKTEEAPAPKEEVVAKEAIKEEDVAAKDITKQEESSQMIFPKLDKESPATSVHQEASAPGVPTLNNEPVDDFDEFVDEPLDDEESEDGFFTDDEYDILDASDEEYLAQQGKPLKK